MGAPRCAPHGCDGPSAGSPMLSGMAFRGWPIEAVEFYEGLEADNTKAYWTAHKPVFDVCVHAPMAALLEELAEEFGPGRIARPYRDVRFRADKSPYKTAIYAMLEDGGYVSFSADGLSAAIGYYMMEPDQLDRYRRAVAAEDRKSTRLNSSHVRISYAVFC